MLRVDVVKLISETFKKIGKPVMSVDELLRTIENDTNVWSMYHIGATQLLNQCERPA